ncbi:sugar phosphate nucleotidyltransferase [Aeribacillus pallidus]|uniref:sugar phosphate nucleotidyltransferase n=1 Tax=Aeribacillus pallidus TaxID=33936 RepID=UPI003D20CCFE
MSHSMLGVIDATSYNESLEDLLLHRSLAAVPFAGRYRLIDFVLSNMVNSGIQSVAIFPKFQYRSLMDHLGSGKNWDLSRKRDGLFFFPSPKLENTYQGIGSFNHFAHHIDYFYRSRQTYALISNCFTVCNMDYRPILQRHIDVGCDITEICHQGRSLEMYIVEKSLLIDLIENREKYGYTCMRDVVTDLRSPFNVCTYEYNGFAVMIDSIQTYYKTSLNLLNREVWNQVFVSDYPIYTKVKDEPPTQYLPGAFVKNSMIANGCVIEGHVENSIIFRAVHIGKGTVIKNSIIMQKGMIGENCELDAVILDKDVKIESGERLRGHKDQPIVIRKGTIQGALMNS